MSSGSTCKAVLVVEDEPDIRDLVVEFLRSERFHVYEAENGHRALDVLAEMPEPALVLADLMMPIMDGAALIAALRADDKFATLPIVIVSAMTTRVPAGYRHLKKPIELDDLARIVAEFCVRES